MALDNEGTEELQQLPDRITVYSEMKKLVTDESIDDFKKPFVKKNVPTMYNGEFSKMLTNADKSARSRQVEVDNEHTLYSVTDTIEPHYNLDSLADLYDIDPHHAAAVDALVDNVVGLGYYFDYSRLAQKARAKASAKSVDEGEKLDSKLEDKRAGFESDLGKMNASDSFDVILEKVAKDRSTMGNAYIEVGRKADGSIGYIGHIPAQTMRVRRQRDGFVQYVGNRPVFFRNFGDTKTRNPFSNEMPNEIIHLYKYSSKDAFYGVPEIVSAADAIAGNQYATRYNMEYFENKAVPRYIIKVKGVKLTLPMKEQLMSFFTSNTKGVSHRTIMVPLPNSERADITFEPIESGKQDASFTEYYELNIRTILSRHRVPMNRLGLGDSSALSSAKEADKIFKASVCGPEQRKLEKLLAKLFDELSNIFVFKLTEYTLTDEDQQSIIDERDLKAGVLLPDERREKLGLPARPDGKGMEALDLRSMSEMEQKAAAESQDKALKSQEKTARESAKAAAATSTASTAVSQAKADQKAAGTRTRDTQRSASRSNAAGAPGTRNAKGEGRKSS